jgi:peptide subunit release factor RF-3
MCKDLNLTTGGNTSIAHQTKHTTVVSHNFTLLTVLNNEQTKEDQTKKASVVVHYRPLPLSTFITHYDSAKDSKQPLKGALKPRVYKTWTYQ